MNKKWLFMLKTLFVTAAFVLVLSGCPNQPEQFMLALGVATDGTGSGSIDTTASTANGSFASGTVITAQATAETGSSFVGWFDTESGGTLVSAENPYTFNLTADMTLYAKFDLLPDTTPPDAPVISAALVINVSTPT